MIAQRPSSFFVTITPNLPTSVDRDTSFLCGLRKGVCFAALAIQRRPSIWLF